MFTDPEFARVGLSEREAKERGISYRLAKLPMTAVLRARTLSETRGFMKSLIAAESDQILGFAALGPEAGELLAAVQIAMSGGLPYTVLRDAVITHPTMSEAFEPLFSNGLRPGGALKRTADRCILPMEPPPATCTNCGVVLTGMYCADCGQHVADSHRSVWRFVADFFDNTLCWDNKLLRTLKPLFQQPGYLTRG